MKKFSEISVIMAEYNTNEHDLREAIQSILDQTYRDFEFIIIDDHGSNNLIKIVTTYNDDRIRIIKNPKNMGLVYSLNNGVKHSRGKYIVRMDTDDIALPNRIEKIYNFIISHPEYDVVGSRAIEFSGNTDYGILGKCGEKTKKSIMRGDTIIHPSVIIRKKSIADVNYYDDYRRSEDLALWCKMVLNKKRIFVLDDILLKYRVNSDNYKKRKLSNRIGELKVRLYYYPKLHAGPIEYFRIVKSIISGTLPIKFVQKYRNRFVLQNDLQKEIKK